MAALRSLPVALMLPTLALWFPPTQLLPMLATLMQLLSKMAALMELLSMLAAPMTLLAEMNKMLAHGIPGLTSNNRSMTRRPTSRQLLCHFCFMRSVTATLARTYICIVLSQVQDQRMMPLFCG